MPEIEYEILTKEPGQKEWRVMRCPYVINNKTMAQNIVLDLTKSEYWKKPGQKSIYQYKEKK